jgi:tRNA(fMet)-specific endonuclease VapC
VTTPRFLLDTNICIYIRRQHPLELLARFRSLHPGEAAISAITYGELRYGAEKSRERDRAINLLNELLAWLPVLPLPARVGETYGAIRLDLERRGEVIGNNDLWIAAHGLAADLVVVTSNMREFARVRGLVLADWLVPG